MVKVSIGLRSAELQGAALPGIMKVPMVFQKVLVNYFTQMNSPEMMRQKISDAREIVNELEQIVCDAGHDMELTVLVDLVCERWQMPMWKTNPLFAKTIACCRRREK